MAFPSPPYIDGQIYENHKYSASRGIWMRNTDYLDHDHGLSLMETLGTVRLACEADYGLSLGWRKDDSSNTRDAVFDWNSKLGITDKLTFATPYLYSGLIGNTPKYVIDPYVGDSVLVGGGPRPLISTYQPGPSAFTIVSLHGYNLMDNGMTDYPIEFVPTSGAVGGDWGIEHNQYLYATVKRNGRATTVATGTVQPATYNATSAQLSHFQFNPGSSGSQLWCGGVSHGGTPWDFSSIAAGPFKIKISSNKNMRIKCFWIFDGAIDPVALVNIMKFRFPNILGL
jgi:hypothetical protein